MMSDSPFADYKRAALLDMQMSFLNEVAVVNSTGAFLLSPIYAINIYI